MNFAENLARLRENRGLTRQQVADELGVTLQAYSAYEAGKREPRRDNILKLASAFGVSTDTLLCYRPNTYAAVKSDLQRLMPISFQELKGNRVVVCLDDLCDAPSFQPELEMTHDELVKLYRWAYDLQLHADSRFGFVFAFEYAKAAYNEADEAHRRKQMVEQVEYEEPERDINPSDFSEFGL